MANLRTELTRASLVAHYHLTKPYGELDVNASLEIPYSAIATLKPVPDELHMHGFYLLEHLEVFVPAVARTIVFVLVSFQESMGRNEEILHGPYVKR